jgi:hypothetical protein
MVFIGSKLRQPLVKDGHNPKVSRKIIHGLTFHHGQDVSSVHQGVVTNGKGASLGISPREAPWITLIAGNPNSNTASSRSTDELGRRPVLLDGPLGQPEDLLVALARPALVGLGQKEEITPLVTLAVQDYRYPPAPFVEGEDRNPLDLPERLFRAWGLLLPQAKDILPRRRPPILGAKDKPGFILPENLQAVGEPLTITLF